MLSLPAFQSKKVIEVDLEKDKKRENTQKINNLKNKLISKKKSIKY